MDKLELYNREWIIIEINKNNPLCRYSNSILILKDKAKTIK